MQSTDLAYSDNLATLKLNNSGMSNEEPKHKSHIHVSLMLTQNVLNIQPQTFLYAKPKLHFRGLTTKANFLHHQSSDAPTIDADQKSH